MSDEQKDSYIIQCTDCDKPCQCAVCETELHGASDFITFFCPECKIEQTVIKCETCDGTGKIQMTDAEIIEMLMEGDC